MLSAVLCSLLFGHVSVPACGADHMCSDAALMLPCCALMLELLVGHAHGVLIALMCLNPKLLIGQASQQWGQQLGCLSNPLLGDLGMLCYHERVQPACKQSLRAGHAYTATLDQQGSGGLGLRPSLVVGDALPFNNLPIDNGSGSVSLLCSDAAGTGLVEL